jgi:gluconate 2-dehydrogenase gamma chain
LKRREFIVIPAKTLGGVLLYSLQGQPILEDRRTASVKVPLRFFTAREAEIIQAACARIFPTDDSGPGATEAGVVVYIDRQLAGPYGLDKYRYTKEPWVEAPGPEYGYQGEANPQEIYRGGIQALGDFTRLSLVEQDEKLESIEKTHFFELLHTHTIEGMFCDPLHGGNVDLVGWQLIGFPGPVMSYRDEIDKNYGRAYRPAPRSLEQILGHPVKGAEDEPV